MSMDIVIQTGIISQLNPPIIDIVTLMMEIPTDNAVIILVDYDMVGTDLIY